MSAVRGNGPGPRIAARLRAKTALQQTSRRRDRSRNAIAVHMTSAEPPPRVIVVRDARVPVSGWGR